jgi:hypothetical protein
MNALRHAPFLVVAAALAVVGWNSGCASQGAPLGSDFGSAGTDAGNARSGAGEPEAGKGGDTGATAKGSASDASRGTDDAGSGQPLLVLGDAAPTPPGVRLCTSQNQCVNRNCPNGGQTTISGTVFDPAGVNPLYNIAVYVPQTKPSPLPKGAACYSCQTLYTGGAVAGTLTDAAGKFSIAGAPTGKGVPLVVQIGKWRMQYTVDINDCQDNPQPHLRLPRNSSEGDLPDIAVSTGGADSFECLFHRIGVDEAEYTAGGGAGHIHIFQGGTGGAAGGGGAGGGGGIATTPGATLGANTPISATTLWPTAASMMPYDIVILSCEGGETANPVPQALNDYANMGGRVFASHFHYSWFIQAPFSSDNLATWTPGANSTGNINALIETTLPSGAVFPKGVAMKAWLTNVNALTNGELPVQVSRHNADVSVANTASTPWIAADPAAPSPGATQYFSWDMPINNPVETLCGRIVYSDLHVGAGSTDYGQMPGALTIPRGATTPSGCASNPLSPQEKALEFMLFDLSSCLTPVGEPPVPPVIVAQ